MAHETAASPLTIVSSLLASDAYGIDKTVRPAIGTFFMAIPWEPSWTSVMRYGVNTERDMACGRLTLVFRGVCSMVKESHVACGGCQSDNHVLNIISTRVKDNIEPRFFLERNCICERI